MRIDGTICGSKIQIRSYEDSDLPFVRSMWFDDENGKYLSDPTDAYIDESFQKAIDGLSESESGYYFVVERKDTQERIGTCCAFPNEDKTVYDIGYCVHKAHWQKGYGTDIVTALEKWIFDRGARKITAEVAAQNTPSNALLKKLGYKVETETQFKKYNMGITYPSFIYAKTEA